MPAKIKPKSAPAPPPPASDAEPQAVLDVRLRQHGMIALAAGLMGGFSFSALNSILDHTSGRDDNVVLLLVVATCAFLCALMFVTVYSFVVAFRFAAYGETFSHHMLFYTALLSFAIGSAAMVLSFTTRLEPPMNEYALKCMVAVYTYLAVFGFMYTCARKPAVE